MRIGIDARMLKASGIGTYLTNLLLELDKLDKRNEYIIFILTKDIKNLELSSKFKLVTTNFPWYSFKEQIFFPSLLNKYKIDIMHFPHFNIPVFYRGKFIVTIHDLTHLDFKLSRASAHNRLYYEFKHQTHKIVFRKAIVNSRKIITVSNYVKNQILERFNVGKSKIEVTYESADSDVANLSKQISIKTQQGILKKFNIKPPYIFYVGNTHPHKNIEGLIRAFAELRKRYQYLQLVLSGKEDFFWRRLKSAVNDKNIKDVKFTGFLEKDELVSIYKNAQAFIFPSFSEGFGIPPLEAMICGTAVVSSNKTALPEIIDDAAMYFDPYDPEDIVEKISLVLNDNKLRKRLIEAGKKRVKDFSWERLAKQTLEVYRSCG